MLEKEKNNLEFKGDLTKTFLKTVSAYSNYRDGQIVFGLDDDGQIKGLSSVEEKKLSIENMINDSIEPQPKFKLNIKEIEGKKLIFLEVFKGKDTPYYYRGKAYKRSDTSTVEVDRLELNRLALEGLNLDYEETKSKRQDLDFTVLEEKLKNVAGIEKLSLDILKTLKLYDKDGYYNMAAELFADENDNNLSGVDIVRFGKNINQILDRETFNNISILSMYDKTVKFFERYYQYEEIEGYLRVRKELIPKEAFREALANGLVHRLWDINAHIQIAMYDDRVEISSPGGLPQGLTIEDYLHEQVSILRNPIISGVFYRLDLIEQFGTGVRKIYKTYEDSITKPKFKISENFIRVVLPVLDKDNHSLSKDEKVIYRLLEDEEELNRNELDIQSGFNKSKTLRVLNNLLEKDFIIKEGSGPGTSYSIKK